MSALSFSLHSFAGMCVLVHMKARVKIIAPPPCVLQGTPCPSLPLPPPAFYKFYSYANFSVKQFTFEHAYAQLTDSKKKIYLLYMIKPVYSRSYSKRNLFCFVQKMP